MASKRKSPVKGAQDTRRATVRAPSEASQSARAGEADEEGPANIGVGPKRAGPIAGGGGAAQRRSSPKVNESHPAVQGDPIDGEYTRLAPEGPGDETIPRLSDTKTVSLKNVGRDAEGKVLPHKRTAAIADIVRKHAVAGTDENTICLLLNLRPGQLRQYYARELDTAVAEVNADVAQAIVRQAKAGHPVLSRFYAKAKMGWKDGENTTLPVSPFSIVIHG